MYSRSCQPANGNQDVGVVVSCSRYVAVHVVLSTLNSRCLVDSRSVSGGRLEYLAECNVAADDVGVDHGVGVGVDHAHVFTWLRRAAVPAIDHAAFTSTQQHNSVMFGFYLGSSSGT